LNIGKELGCGSSLRKSSTSLFHSSSYKIYEDVFMKFVGMKKELS
jgi:hypothetical protein